MNKSQLIVMIAVVLFCDVAFACPSCRDAVAAESAGSDLATGFALSIGLLLAVPLALVSTGAVAVWRASRGDQQDG